MSGLQYRDPVRAISGSTVFPGAYVSVSESGTDTLVPIFADAAQAVPLSNPLRADSAGDLPPIYCDSEGLYRVQAEDEDGNVFFTADDLTGQILPLALAYADPRDSNGESMPLATRTFYAASTTELETIYGNEALSTPITNPQSADSGGEFAEVWLNVTRTYRVQLHDRHGRLVYDVERLAFDPGVVPPTAPVLSGAIDGTDIDLEWTEATSQFGEIAGYRLYDASDDTLIFDTEDPDDRDYTFGPISEGNTYSFYVIAYDTDGNDSERSNTVSFSVGVSIEIITESRDWTKPDNLLSAEVTSIGPGGGGRGGAATVGGGFPPSGGAGGGGGIAQQTFLDAELPSTVSVVIGAPGAGGAGAIRSTGGTTNGTNGGDGGTTSFGGLLSAAGGEGGHSPPDVYSGGDGGAGATEDGGNGGRGHISNQAGPGPDATDGESTTLSAAGGGGGAPLDSFATPGDAGNGGSNDECSGGAAGAGATGSSGTVTAANGGDGGSDLLASGSGAGAGGGGGGCAGGNSGSGANATAGHGGAGGGFGGGGGGGGAAQAAGGKTARGGNGGTGGGGAVILRYTYVS